MGGSRANERDSTIDQVTGSKLGDLEGFEQTVRELTYHFRLVVGSSTQLRQEFHLQLSKVQSEDATQVRITKIDHEKLKSILQTKLGFDPEQHELEFHSLFSNHSLHLCRIAVNNIQTLTEFATMEHYRYSGTIPSVGEHPDIKVRFNIVRKQIEETARFSEEYNTQVSSREHLGIKDIFRQTSVSQDDRLRSQDEPVHSIETDIASQPPAGGSGTSPLPPRGHLEISSRLADGPGTVPSRLLGGPGKSPLPPINDQNSQSGRDMALSVIDNGESSSKNQPFPTESEPDRDVDMDDSIFPAEQLSEDSKEDEKDVLNSLASSDLRARYRELNIDIGRINLDYCQFNRSSAGDMFSEDDNEMETVQAGVMDSCDAITTKRVQTACSFFGVSEVDFKNTMTKISIPHLNKPLYPYQAFAVIFALEKQSSIWNGCFIGDQPGLGKSLESLAIWVVNCWLEYAWARIHASRSSGDGCHLTKEEADLNPGRVCPSDVGADGGRSLFFHCPCSRTSVAHAFQLVPGCALVLPPAGLSQNWEKEFCKHVNREGPLNLRLVSMVSLNMRQKTAADLVELCQGKHACQTLILGTHKLAETLFKEYITHKKYGIKIGAVFVDEFHEMKGKDTGFIQTLTKLDKATHVVFLSGTPCDRKPHDLTGPLKVLQRGWNEEMRQSHFYWKNLTKKSSESGLMGVFSKCDTITGILAKLNSSSSPDPWNDSLKGPMRRKCLLNIQQIQSVLPRLMKSCMIRRTTTSDWFGGLITNFPPHIHRDVALNVRPEVSDQLKSLFLRTIQQTKSGKGKQRAQSSNHSNRRYLQASGPESEHGAKLATKGNSYLNPLIIDDSDPTSKRKGGQQTSEHDPQSNEEAGHDGRKDDPKQDEDNGDNDDESTSDDESDEDMSNDEEDEDDQDEEGEEIANKAKARKPNANTAILKNRLRTARIWSTFPNLLISTVDGKSVLEYPNDSEAVREMFLNPNADSWVAKLLPLISKGPKCRALIKIIASLDVDIHGREEKVVIFCTYPFEAAMLNEWLNYYYGKNTSKFISRFMSREERTSCVQEFNNDTGDNPRFLVSTPAILGRGLDLCRAFRIIQLGPEFVRREETQEIGRVSRLIQENPVTFSYRLYIKDNEPEEWIIRKQIARLGVAIASMGAEVEDPPTPAPGKMTYTYAWLLQQAKDSDSTNA